ncbi:MAG TPA: sulfotransferase [Pyrinomonadaceae bacterium]|nr:sulfotransferase [Pyrinomonadaceae bacterium]
MKIPEAKTVERPDVVCILGMHRSGTSLLTKILNLVGLYLSPAHVSAQPADDNPKGHWEHSEIVSLNDAILTRYGGTWDEPPQLPSGWEKSSLIEDLKQRAQTLIDDQFSGVSLWGWKDPRTCITLPFWQQLLPNMRYVICLRNPSDVARSLQSRNAFSAEKSSRLWFRYVHSAFQLSEGKPRLVVFYEDLMKHHLRETQRLADFMGTSEMIQQEDVQAVIQEFVEKGLQHHRTSIARTMASPRIDLPTRAFYIAQRISVSLGQSEIDDDQLNPEIEAALDILNSYSQAPGRVSASEEPATAGVFQTLSTELAEENRNLQLRNESLEERVADLELESKRLVAESARASAEAASVISLKDHQIGYLEGRLTEGDKHIASLYHTIAGFEAAPWRRAMRLARRTFGKLGSEPRSGSSKS